MNFHETMEAIAKRKLTPVQAKDFAINQWGLVASVFKAEAVSEFSEKLNFEISFESGKELKGEWTAEYRAGFVDGLKRAKELLDNKN